LSCLSQFQALELATLPKPRSPQRDERASPQAIGVQPNNSSGSVLSARKKLASYLRQREHESKTARPSVVKKNGPHTNAANPAEPATPRTSAGPLPGGIPGNLSEGLASQSYHQLVQHVAAAVQQGIRAQQQQHQRQQHEGWNNVGLQHPHNSQQQIQQSFIEGISRTAATSAWSSHPHRPGLAPYDNSAAGYPGNAPMPQQGEDKGRVSLHASSLLRNEFERPLRNSGYPLPGPTRNNASRATPDTPIGSPAKNTLNNAPFWADSVFEAAPRMPSPANTQIFSPGAQTHRANRSRTSLVSDESPKYHTPKKASQSEGGIRNAAETQQFSRLLDQKNTESESSKESNSYAAEMSRLSKELEKTQDVHMKQQFKRLELQQEHAHERARLMEELRKTNLALAGTNEKLKSELKQQELKLQSIHSDGIVKLTKQHLEEKTSLLKQMEENSLKFETENKQLGLELKRLRVNTDSMLWEERKRQKEKIEFVEAGFCIYVLIESRCFTHFLLLFDPRAHQHTRPRWSTWKTTSRPDLKRLWRKPAKRHEKRSQKI
jgi:hypothetical protein